jgi:hypothetical protein
MDQILILGSPYAANANILFQIYFGPVVSVPKHLSWKPICSRADAIAILLITLLSLLQPGPCFFPIDFFFLSAAAAAYHLLRPSAPHARLAICTR